MKNKKARDSQGLFVTEGRKLFEEAPKEQLVQVLMTAAYERSHPEVRAMIPENVPVLGDMEESRFLQISDTKSPQGIMSILQKPDLSAEQILSEHAEERAPLFLILENLQDPGNVGTMLRTGEAAGVTAVFLTKGSADLYSPKTIRSTMGSIYRVPHAYIENVPSFLERLKAFQVTSYAAHLRGDRNYTDCDFKNGTALIIGNEGNGILDETADAADILMKIPMKGRVESLNAAMAAGVLMYEAARQRF